MKRKAIKKIVGASLISGVFVAIATVILLSNNVGVVFTPEIIEEKYSYKPIVLPLLGDADPGSGASGVMTAYVTVQGTDYTTNNLTAGEIYASGDTNDTSIGSDVPYSPTAHDLVVKVRWNVSHAYDSAWNLSLVRAYVNCTDLGLSGEPAEEAEITSDANFIYVHYYVDNSDAGFTINRGETVSDVQWNFEYYG